MATATDPKPKASNKNLKLMGPAQTEYKTIMDQCIYFANLYWPDWNNYENPSSYMIPPIFSYKHPDVSDEAIRTADIETIRLAENAAYSTMDRLITDRTSDIAEHLVYTVLQQLIEDKVQAPLVVVHNLSIHDNRKLLSELFPILDEEPFREAFKSCQREYDFLILGPRVGIVAIEVKSSKYTQGTDFNAKNKHLPTKYYKGIQQLQSVDALLHILSICAKIDSPSIRPIRKFIFTPNLDRIRYDVWQNSVDSEARQEIESLTEGVIQWFTDDMDNCAMDSKKPPLYTIVRKVLIETNVECLPPNDEIENYILFISGLRSMIQLGGNLQLNTIHISPNEAVLSEHQRIVEQKPLDGKGTKLSKHSLLKPIDRTKLCYEPILFFLSPDQQAVLEGPERQFIIGAAGTGKTVLLQAKALQLLSEGEAVVVFSPKCFIKQYKKLFDSYGFKNYQCLEWPHEGFKHLCTYFNECVEKENTGFRKRTPELALNQAFSVEDVLNHIREYVNEDATSQTLEWLRNKNIMIDDTFDPGAPITGWVTHVQSLFVAWSLMEYIGAVCPTKTAWIVLDPAVSCFEWRHRTRYLGYKQIFRTALDGLLCNGLEQGGVERISVSILRQVMRCSESVFLSAFAGTHKIPWSSGTEPIIAHKIQGLQTEIVREFFDSTTEGDAMLRLRDKVREILKCLSREGVDMANVAIVLGDTVAYVFFAKESVRCFYYDEVSSMEWPIVIYASCVPENYKSKEAIAVNHRSAGEVSYPIYRAMTRATTRLIDITVTYKVPDDNN